MVYRVPDKDPAIPGSIPGNPDFLKSNGSGTGSTRPREDS
jgi:hypothetical protein